MFDIGFAELIIIGVVALLVIGPERLPSTIRTVSLYVNRIRRGFNDIKQEVQRELHNDAVMQELRQAGEQLKQDGASLGNDIKNVGDSVRDGILDSSTATTQTDNTTYKTETADPADPTAPAGDANPIASSEPPEKKAE